MAVGPVILCVGMNEKKAFRIGMLCAGLGIAVKDVPPKRQGMRIGVLCGADPDTGKDLPGRVPGEMLVMAGFSDRLTDAFLAALRSAGCAVPLKAVMTPYNREWSCERLYRELAMEALSFGRAHPEKRDDRVDQPGRR